MGNIAGGAVGCQQIRTRSSHTTEPVYLQSQLLSKEPILLPLLFVNLHTNWAIPRIDPAKAAQWDKGWHIPAFF